MRTAHVQENLINKRVDFVMYLASRRSNEPPSMTRYNRLTEDERATESRGFHSFLTGIGLVNRTITKEECRDYFRAYCRRNAIQLGYAHMGWSQVVFILRKMDACVRSYDGNRFTVKEWPTRHDRTPRLALDHYMVMRRSRAADDDDDDEQYSRSGNRATLSRRIHCVLKEMREHRSALIQNKNGVTITSEGDRQDGKITMGKLFVGASVEVMYIDISVNSRGRAQKLVNCDALATVTEYTLSDRQLVCGGLGSVEIPPGGQYQIEARCRPLCLGYPRVTIAFEFEDSESGVNYHIIRFLLARVTDADAELLKPTAPFKRPAVKARRGARYIVEGCPPPSSSRSQLKFKRWLGRYAIPSGLRYCVNKGTVSGEYKEQVEALLCPENYNEKFQALLHVEELQMEVDIRHYDMDSALLKQSHSYLILEVPGLAENRPSLLKGDRLYASRQGSDTEYEGYVHDVWREEVHLKFAPSFHASFIRGQKFNIRFTFNRVPLKLQHRSVELFSEDEVSCQQMAFPKSSHSISRRTPLHPISSLQLFNQLVGNNPEQWKAVQHILAGTSRPAPYLVFGPPGTGKTMTTVEAMKQVWKKIAGSRMLACTPSNSAADDLASRLLAHIPSRDIVRLNAYGRSPEAIDPFIKEKIMKISKYDTDSGHFWFPPVEDLQGYRIIVATLVTAGRLVSAAFPRDHFTHVFIDEAGHAVEPECVIPVAGLLSVNNPSGGQLVLAGDPKQLGPILRSSIAIENGLQLSFLERLMGTCRVYRKRTTLSGNSSYDSRVVTKLVQNYRSHPAILALPNRLFYENELQAKADEFMRSSLCEWKHLPKKGFPIIFHGIEGQDEREERSPSFFNAAEASQVAKYIEMMKDTRGIRIVEGDIGVISPYRKQVQKIRQLLRGKQILSVKVGSVEEFQGNERRVIIISTVRSSKEFLEMDEKYSLGFLKNPKRFNVAVTRAKALLIVIGNPYLLSMDEYWNELLEYCREKGGYTGCYYSPRLKRDRDLLRQLQDLHLDRDDVYTAAEDLASAETGGVSFTTEQEDPEWREGE